MENRHEVAGSLEIQSPQGQATHHAYTAFFSRPSRDCSGMIIFTWRADLDGLALQIDERVESVQAPPHDISPEFIKGRIEAALIEYLAARQP